MDFNSYMASLFRSIKETWYKGMPPSVVLGQQGKNVVRFRVLRDGTVPNDFLKLDLSSEKNELDKASLHAVRKAAPFKPLPEKYSQPYIELRLTFFYNIPSQKQ